MQSRGDSKVLLANLAVAPPAAALPAPLRGGTLSFRAIIQAAHRPEVSRWRQCTAVCANAGEASLPARRGLVLASELLISPTFRESAVRVAVADQAGWTAAPVGMPVSAAGLRVGSVKMAEDALDHREIFGGGDDPQPKRGPGASAA